MMSDESVTLPDEGPIPVVAVVGRPNVGKSTLVNRILGRRAAGVEDVPGVTPERVTYDARWNAAALGGGGTGADPGTARGCRRTRPWGGPRPRHVRRDVERPGVRRGRYRRLGSGRAWS